MRDDRREMRHDDRLSVSDATSSCGRFRRASGSQMRLAVQAGARGVLWWRMRAAEARDGKGEGRRGRAARRRDLRVAGPRPRRHDELMRGNVVSMLTHRRRAAVRRRSRELDRRQRSHRADRCRLQQPRLVGRARRTQKCCCTAVEKMRVEKQIHTGVTPLRSTRRCCAWGSAAAAGRACRSAASAAPGPAAHAQLSANAQMRKQQRDWGGGGAGARTGGP